jgi:hypothetical protein
MKWNTVNKRREEMRSKYAKYEKPEDRPDGEEE